MSREIPFLLGLLLLTVEPAYAAKKSVFAVAAHGEIAVFLTSDTRHAVHIVDRKGQTTAKLPMAAAYGSQLAFDGRTLFVSVPGDDVRGEDTGAVQVFERASGWGQRQVLRPSDARTLWSSFLRRTVAPKLGFGSVLAVDGAHALIAGRADRVVFSFIRKPDGTWHQTGQFEAPGVVRGIDLSGRTAALRLHDDAADMIQLVALDEKNTWRGVQTLGSAGAGDVAIHDDTLVVGFPTASVGHSSAQGVALVYVRGADGRWSNSQRLVAHDGVEDDRFGTAVAVTADGLAINAPTFGDSTRRGGIWLFERQETGAWLQRRRYTLASGQIGGAIGLGTHTLVTTVSRSQSSVPPVFDLGASMMGAGPYCGDGVIDAGESCDDGGRQDGDGCSAQCAREICGDGIQQPREACDDGNTKQGDGCGPNCRIETCRPSDAGCVAELSPVGRRPTRDGFGAAIAVAGSTALIGATDDTQPGQAGAAYLMERDKAGAWHQVFKFAPTLRSTDQLGAAVALRSKRAVVGAPGRHDPGQVFVLERIAGQWQQTQVIRAGRSRRFGHRVAQDETTIAIASTNAVHLFEREGSEAWSQRQVLSPPPVEGERPACTLPYSVLLGDCHLNSEFEGSRFGDHLVLQDGVLWVSADQASFWQGVGDEREKISGAGLVHLYRRNDRGRWVLRQTLRAPTPQGLTNFGLGIAVHGDTAVIGARAGAAGARVGGLPSERWEHGPARLRRHVHTFRRDSHGRWRHAHDLVAPARKPGSWAKMQLALTAKHLIVTAPRESAPDDASSAVGAAYVFRRAAPGWRLVRRHAPADMDALHIGGAMAPLNTRHVLIATGRRDMPGVRVIRVEQEHR